MINIFEYIKNLDPAKGEDDIKLLIDRYDFPNINLSTTEIKALNFKKVNEYCVKGYFLFENANKEICIAINNLGFLRGENAELTLLKQIFLVKKTDFYNILTRDFTSENTHNSLNLLADINPASSAKNINYPKMVIGFFVIFFTTFIAAINCFNLINNLLYFIQNLLKAIISTRSIFAQRLPVEQHLNKIFEEDIHKDNLPIYSILIPLYKEEIKASSILLAVEKLNYPKHKLDVKLVIESDDQMTIRALAGLFIPNYVHIIKVPYSLPRTKPKALNYAMPFVVGKYLTIYDAEDEPDRDQLLKAVQAFEDLPQEYVCLQAKLNFYNARENFLTKFFSIEYSIWFEYFLHGLSLFDLPFTLGGTSNHFKVDKLREVGLWDPYNVTEDADLGIRLYLSGYKVGMIDSITMEEAPNNIKDWMGQRARWIKGFLQTIYIFMQAHKNYKQLGIIKIFTVYFFVGMSTYSFFFLPWLGLLLYLDFHPVFYYLWLANSIFSFSYMYIIAYSVTFRPNSLVRIKSISDIFILISWPLYFILHTIASYRALWETIRSPFEWNKTPHGSSNIDDTTKEN